MPSGPRALLAELERRRVYRASAYYLAASLGVLGVVDLLVSAFALPGWILTGLVVLAMVGFPIAVALSWAFEIGPEGVRRTAAVGAGEPGIGGNRMARILLVAGVTVVSLGLGLTSWLLWLGPETSPGAAAGPGERDGFDPRRIAVLYLDDHSPDQSLGYLAAGLTESLIHSLAQVRSLRVTSRNGVKPFRDGEVPVDSIVKMLQVGSLVEGSVSRSGEVVRVTLQLIDAAEDEHLMSRTVERPMGELFALQDELTEELDRALRVRLGATIQRSVERGRTESVEAWTLVQRARELVTASDSLGMQDQDGRLRELRAADSLLALAEARDPRWAEPAVVRAEVARDVARIRVTPPELVNLDDARVAIAHLERALAVDPNHALALVIRGQIRSFLSDDPRMAARADSLAGLAEADLRRGLALDPGIGLGWWVLSELLRRNGQFQEARNAAIQALDADEFLSEAPAIVHQLYHTAFEAEDVGEARRWCDEGRRRYPARSDFVLCQLFLMASVDAVAPDLARAWRLADSLVGTVRTEDRAIFRTYGTIQVAKVAARSGRPDSARALIRAARGDEPIGWLAYDEAHARLILGEKDRALDLVALYLEYDPSRKSYLPNDWWFRPLWQEPRFIEMTAGPGA